MLVENKREKITVEVSRTAAYGKFCIEDPI